MFLPEIATIIVAGLVIFTAVSATVGIIVKH